MFVCSMINDQGQVACNKCLKPILAGHGRYSDGEGLDLCIGCNGFELSRMTRDRNHDSTGPEPKSPL